LIHTIAGTGTPGVQRRWRSGRQGTIVLSGNMVAGIERELVHADSANNRVRKVTAAGVISTVAVTEQRDSQADGDAARHWRN